MIERCEETVPFPDDREFDNDDDIDRDLKQQECADLDSVICDADAERMRTVLLVLNGGLSPRDREMATRILKGTTQLQVENAKLDADLLKDHPMGGDAKDRFALCDPPRKCYRCGEPLCHEEVRNLPKSALCGCCDDQETHIRQDAQGD